MAKHIIGGAGVFAGALDLSQNVGSIRLGAEGELLDATPIGATTREKLAGMRSVAMEQSGFFEALAVTSEPDASLHSYLGLVDVPVTIAPTSPADGSLAYAFLAAVGKYTRGGNVGEVMPFDFSAEGAGPLVNGFIMHNAARTTTGNGTARQLGALSATQRMYAALHVLAVSGGTPSLTVKIQSDDAVGFPSPTDQITFGAKTAAGYDWSSKVGAVTDDYWRVSWTISGSTPSFLFVVTLGIGPA